MRANNLFSSVGLGILLSWQQAKGVDDLKVSFMVDGMRVTVSSTTMDFNDYYIPISEAVPSFTHGVGSCVINPDSVEIKVGDATVIRIKKWGYTAELFDPASPGGPIRSFQMNAPIKADPKSPDTCLIDVKSLCDLVGDSVEIENGNVAVLTPKFWAERLHLNGDKAEKATLQNVAWMPAIGITPPAKDIIVWIRPEERLFAQVYDVTTKVSKASLGVDAKGDEVENFGEAGEEKLRAAEKMKPIQLESRMLDKDKYMRFAVLLLRSDPLYRAPGSAIGLVANGQVPSTDYMVFGVQQRVERTKIDYSLYPVTKTESIEAIASKFNHSPSFIAALNGFSSKDILQPGQKLIIPNKSRWSTAYVAKKETRFKETGPYEVHINDTVQKLATRWQVKPEWIADANPQLFEDGEVHNGDWIDSIAPIIEKPLGAPPPPPPSPPSGPHLVATASFRSKLVKPVKLLQSSDPNGPGKVFDVGTPLVVMEEVRGAGAALYRVSIHGQLGVVPISCVKPNSNPVLVASNGNSSKIWNVAKQYIGVPYHFGSTNIHQEGKIDCSNFVAEVFQEAGYPSPEPPVHNQEGVGQVVHTKGVEYERSGGPLVSQASESSLDSLKPGDRIIIQIDPKRPDVSGWHHTGIYIGPLDYEGHHYLHAVIHAGQPAVRINELTDNKLWKHYRYAVRSSGLPQ